MTNSIGKILLYEALGLQHLIVEKKVRVSPEEKAAKKHGRLAAKMHRKGNTAQARVEGQKGGAEVSKGKSLSNTNPNPQSLLPYPSRGKKPRSGKPPSSKDVDYYGNTILHSTMQHLWPYGTGGVGAWVPSANGDDARYDHEFLRQMAKSLKDTIKDARSKRQGKPNTPVNLP